MRKIISLFVRNETDHLVRNEVVPGAKWVVTGEGVATRKYDGTACLVRGGRLYRRYELKAGKTPPAQFEPAQEPDPPTGDLPGWVPVLPGSEDRWHREAFYAYEGGIIPSDGTYELCGPKIQGNPEGFRQHILVRHGATLAPGCPRDFEGIKHYLQSHWIEGVVWHHPDGRMVKIKARDFGLKR